MHMNVEPIATLDPRINEIRALTAQIVNRETLPNERKLWAGWRDGATDQDRRVAPDLRASIKATVDCQVVSDSVRRLSDSATSSRRMTDSSRTNSGPSTIRVS